MQARFPLNGIWAVVYEATRTTYNERGGEDSSDGPKCGQTRKPHRARRKLPVPGVVRHPFAKPEDIAVLYMVQGTEFDAVVARVFASDIKCLQIETSPEKAWLSRVSCVRNVISMPPLVLPPVESTRGTFSFLSRGIPPPVNMGLSSYETGLGEVHRVKGVAPSQPQRKVLEKFISPRTYGIPLRNNDIWTQTVSRHETYHGRHTNSPRQNAACYTNQRKNLQHII
ncbi:hypothetical protein SODALDRAFT_41139 [Sodiomyces alkalinus F11]|uniref:Uncharacterized protein n=1 Tax=Sodiomyces alkalinus (strain CBS 110278 / VKM F-3762 / F11) TaxID=1314773 RepID=A0A3N2Q9R9_SODAK|nr:hypothetical protein SODALDRAFT_41139 [Sodiomyces alkalinus F11]ROT43514.1 hypothetical protein SODALDRAFT_41139 [Sodiomyces alkalinus F11]